MGVVASELRLPKLCAAGVGEELRMALFGHGWRGTSTTRGYGAKDMVLRFTPTALAQAVARVNYPGLDLSHLVPLEAAPPKHQKR